MESSNSTLLRKAIFVVYALAFVGLAGFGIWDVTNIITDYIEDNQFSLVKVRNNTVDRYRFVPKLLACGSPVFLISGSNADSNDRVNSSWHREDIAWPKNMSEKEASLASDEINLRKMDLITLMDNIGPDSVNDAADYVLNVGRSDFKVMVSNFIKNPQSIISTKRALVTAKNAITQGRPKTNDSSPIQAVLKDNLLCLSLPLADDLLEAGKNRVQYLFNFMYKESNSNISIRQLSMGYTLANKLITVDSSTKTTAITLVTIATNGLFDSTRFPPCASDFEGEADCLQDLKRRVIAEICQCIQFSYAWRNDFFGNKTEKSWERFCTPEIYDECWEKADEEVKRRQKVVAESGACKPCLFAKNTYSVITIKDSPVLLSHLEQSFHPWYPASSVSFQCAETTYLLFEERQQFSPSQLVSQIGGDLGLYIGFSMISILQLIVYLYNLRRRRQEFLSVDGPAQKGRGQSMQFYVKQFFSSVIQTDLSISLKEERRASHERASREDLIALKNEMRNEINQLEARLYEKLDVILRESRSVSNSKSRQRRK